MKKQMFKKLVGMISVFAMLTGMCVYAAPSYDEGYYRIDFDDCETGPLTEAQVEAMGFNIRNNNEANVVDPDFKFEIVEDETEGRKYLKIENNSLSTDSSPTMWFSYPLNQTANGRVRADFNMKIVAPENNKSAKLDFYAFGTSKANSASQIYATLMSVRKNNGTVDGHYWCGDGVAERNIGGSFDEWHNISLIVNTYDESTTKGNWSFSVDGEYIPQNVGNTKYTSGLSNQVSDIDMIQMRLRWGFAVYLDSIEVRPDRYEFDFEDGAVGTDLTAQPYYFNEDGGSALGTATIVTDPLDPTNKCMMMESSSINAAEQYNVRIPLGDIDLTDSNSKKWGKGLDGRVAVEFRIYDNGSSSSADKPDQIYFQYRDAAGISKTLTSINIDTSGDTGKFSVSHRGNLAFNKSGWNTFKFILNPEKTVTGNDGIEYATMEEFWCNGEKLFTDEYRAILPATLSEMRLRAYGNGIKIYLDDLKVYSLEGIYHKADNFTNDGTKISGAVNISQYKPMSGKLITALYNDDGVVSDVQIADLDNVLDCLAKEYTVEFDTTVGTKVKAMLWDSIDTIRPLRTYSVADVTAVESTEQ